VTESSPQQLPPLDVEETARMIERLSADLSRIRRGEDDLAHMREDVERLRQLLAAPEPAAHEVHDSLHGLRERVLAASDEVRDEMMKAGDYLARIGRLLGL
jgi:hypothetical protein